MGSIQFGDSDRLRCTTCGNLTRFDVVKTITTSSYHHYTVGGELTIEEEEVVETVIKSVMCRWCGPSGEVIVIEGPDTG